MSSKNITEEVVQMTFDNKAFEKNVKESKKSIEDLRNAINMDGATKAFASVQASIDSLNSKFSALGVAGITVIQNITNKAIDMATQLTRAFAIAPVTQGFGEYELKMGSIQTIMASTGEDLATVNKKLDELNTYADKTIYSFSDMTSNIGKFTNAGVKLDQAVAAIQGVSNVAAVSGANANEASRAMYNFAQALSAGYVKLIDWKSIENANMATVEFKQQLIDTAVEMGTLVKVGEEYQSTTTDNNGKVSALFTTTKNFNDALSAQWMTTDVLTTTLAKYADETTDIGKKAFAAAQDVKTFSQLIDTIKEAIGSGWAKTFELIIGDFNQAKELFTSINNVVSTFVDNMSDARNNLLAEALGGPTKASDEIISAGDAAEYTSKKLEEYQKIANEVQNGDWGNGEERLRRLTEAGYDYDAVMMLVNHDILGWEIDMQKFEEATKSAVDATEELTSANEKTGRELLLEALANVAKGAGKIFKSVGEAYRSIFPPMTAKRLKDIIQKFNEFSQKLIISDKTAYNLKSTFKGVFSVFKLLGNAFGAILRTLSPVVGLAKSFISLFLDQVAAPIGRFVTNITHAIVEADFFYKVLDTIRQLGAAIFDPLVNGIKNFLEEIGLTLPKSGSFSKALTKISDKVIDFVKAFDGTPVVEKFKNVIANIGDFLSPVIDILKNGAKHVVDFFKSFLTKNTDDAEKKVGVFDSVIERVGERFKPLGVILGAFKKLFTAIFDLVKKAMPFLSQVGTIFANAFGGIVDAIANGISNFNFEKAWDLLNTGIFSGILLSINGFASNLNNLGEDLSFDGIIGKITDFFKNGPLKDVIGILNDARGALQAWTANIKSKTLRNIAVSVAILAASLIALSLVDSEKLAGALGGITVLFGDLVAAMTLLDKGVKRGLNMMAIGQSIRSIAIGVLILAAAVSVLAKLDEDALMRGIVGLGAVMTELYLFVLGMRNQELSKKSIAGVITLAIGIRLLVGAVKKLADIDTEGLIKGVAALGAIFLELGLFMYTMSQTESSISFKQGMALIAMAVALRLMVGAVKGLGEIDTETLLKGLLALGALLLEIGTFSRIFDNMKFSSAVGLVVMAGAMAIFAKVLRTLGELSLENIGKGLLALGGGLLLMAAAANAMRKAMKGAAAMMVMSVALLALAAVMKILGSMSLEDILLALIAMAGAFTILGIAGYALGPVTGTILALAAAMAIFGVACLAVGAGVLMLSAGLAGLALSGAGAAASLQVIVASLLGLIPLFFKQLALGITSFLEGLASSADALAESLIIIVNASCNALNETIPTIVDTLFNLLNTVLDKLINDSPELIDKLITFVCMLLTKLAERAPELVGSVVDLVIAVIDGITAKVADIMNSVTALIKAIFDTAATNLPTIIDSFVGFVVAIINCIKDNVERFTEAVTDLVNTIFNAIGNLIGSVIGGLIEGIISGASDSMDSLSKTLGSFMDNADGFFEAVKVVDNDSVQGVINLCKVIWALTKQEILDKLTSWRKRTTLSDFGDKLVEFGPKFKQYYDSVKDIDYGVVSASAIVMRALIVLSKEIPNTGGLVSYFTGDNDIDDWGVMLVKFGYCLKKYGEHVKDLDSDIVVKSSKAMSSLIALSREIPNTGGIVSFFTGDNDIESFGTMLVKFGWCFKRYSQIIKDVDGALVTNTTNIMSSIVELAKEIPDSGGLFSLFTGDNSIDDFGTDLSLFAEKFVAYSDTLKDVNWVNVWRLPGLMNSILDIADRISDNENLDTLSGFASTMYDIVQDGIIGFLSAIEDEDNVEDIENAADSITKIFTDQLQSDENTALYNDAGQYAVTKFNGGINDKIQNVANRVNEDIVKTIADTIRDKNQLFNTLGKSTIQFYINGIRDKETQVNNACVRITRIVYDALRGSEDSAYNAGTWAAYGFCAGIAAKQQQAYNAGWNLGIAAMQGTADAQRSSSPSKEFAKLGGYAGEGYAIGMVDQYNNVASASEGLGLTAIDVMQSIVERVNALLGGTDEFNPVITPVLDLSKVNEGVGALGGIFGNMHLAIPGTAVLGDSMSSSIDIQEQVRRGVLEALKQNPISGGDTNNFYIDGSGNNADDIADAVIDKLNLRYNQRRAVFG